MDISQKILSDIVVFNKYARHLPKEDRRETWEEIVERNKQIHLKKFPEMKEELDGVYELVLDRKILPSMRSLQFAGPASELNPARLYNCSFMIVNDYRVFQEAMYLLLSGTGVGYSVQKHHVAQLPEIHKPSSKRTRRYVIGDSITGWADAIKMLMKSYFGLSKSKIEFDYRDIRPKGALLVTSGGKAPGPQPLKECITKIQGLLDNKEDGSKLTTLEAHTIMCHIADAVLAGGIRRAALIALFSLDDKEMIACKTGNWWEKHPERGRANNSAVVVRSLVKKDDFDKLWDYMQSSGTGEPGIFFTNNPEMGTNPCCEISLKDMQFCNLTEINVSELDSEEDFYNRVWGATFLGTLQASYTDFHYLRDEWKDNCEKDALLGVSLTGIASNDVFNYDLNKAAEYVKYINENVANTIGINKAARTTCVKPSGTASIVLGTSSGIHAWHDKYYWRRMRVNKSEAIYTYLLINHPELLEDEYFDPEHTAIIKVPQKAPDNAITRDESAMDLLTRIKKVSTEWVHGGYREGYNQHNVSATVTIKPHEWEEVREWMWDNRDTYTGLSILPYSEHTYKQPPFETCTKEEYEEVMKILSEVDLSKVVEINDNTTLQSELACSGGNCEIQ